MNSCFFPFNVERLHKGNDYYGESTIIMMIIIAKDGAIRKYTIHEHTDCKRICLVSLCISVRRNNDKF